MSEFKYDLVAEESTNIFPAPELDYKPKLPHRYRPKIGLIGCGGITTVHLQAYKKDGLDVVALCDLNEKAAFARKENFFPEAEVYIDYHELLQRKDIDVVDIALHPVPRMPAIDAALKAGKHVLSQKPYVLDLAEGRRLAELAKAQGVKLAVNQNARWAPYVRYLQLALESGVIGQLQSVTIALNWDHSGIENTAFEKIENIIIYDFAIHWIDMCRSFMGEQVVQKVFASKAHAPEQTVKPPLLANIAIQFEQGIATLVFDGFSKEGKGEAITLVGSKGTIKTQGDMCCSDSIVLSTAKGVCSIDRSQLKGAWFPDGFRGAMGELLCAIEEKREPANSAYNNLRSLELCFAAIASADCGEAIVPGEVTALGKSCQIAD